MTTQSAISKAAMDAVIAVIADDPEMAADAIATIANSGPAHVHAALCGWSGPVVAAMDDGQPGFWGIEITDTKTGRKVANNQSGIPQSDLDAVRIVTCFGNRDHDTIAAIVRTYWQAGPEQLATLMASSVRLSAEVLKQQAGMP